MVVDSPTLGCSDNTSSKKEPAAATEQGDERRLNISVTGGQSGTNGTVVLTVHACHRFTAVVFFT